MTSGNMISAVRLASGWSVVVSGRILFGWRAGNASTVENRSFSALFDAVSASNRESARIALGLARSDFLIRVGSGSVAHEFPDVHRLLFWQRPVDSDGNRLVETIAMRRDEVESIVMRARNAGFAEVLVHPSWFCVISGWPRLSPGELFHVEDGSIQRTKHGWSPLRRPVSTDPVRSHGYQMNLGSLLLLRGRGFPEGWRHPLRSRGILRLFSVMIFFLFCMMIWFVSGTLRYNAAIGAERAEHSRLIAETTSTPTGCTIGDLVEFFTENAAHGDSNAHLTQFVYTGTGEVELIGHAVSVNLARTIVERFRADRFSITQRDDDARFSFSKRLSCAH